MLGLLVVVATAMVMAFGPWRETAEFDEGVGRFETLLRMARADAANTGRRVRLRFDAEIGTCRVLWEPDPLGEPGQFVDYTVATWTAETPNELLRVVRCVVTDPIAPATSDAGGPGRQDEDDEMQALTFQPDGSSDSAEIELAPVDEDDQRRALVELNGMDNTITTTFLTVEQIEAK